MSRIFVSVPDDRHLDDRRRGLKRAIVGAIAKLGFEVTGFEPEQMGLGKPANADDWTAQRAQTLLQRCDGILVLALARMHIRLTSGNPHEGLPGIPVPTVYNHLEGALGMALGLPVLVVAEEGMDRSGILASGVKSAIIPLEASSSWVESSAFRDFLPKWAERVQERRDVFLGYCSKGSSVAAEVRDFLEGHKFSVLDWSRDFRKAGATILQEIERAATRCRAAVFLLTKDDELATTAQAKATFDAVPRDNVLVEAGYFTRARGSSHVALIRETGTKMPADFGGIIYLGFDDRKDLSVVKQGLLSFLSDAL